MRKQILITTALILTALNMSAENRCYINDFYISPGESKVLEIIVENDIDFTTFTCVIHMPEGLEIYQEGGEYIFDHTPERATRSHGYPASALQQDGGVMVFGESTTNANYKGNSGALITFTVTASDTFTGTHEILLDRIDIVSNYNNNAQDNWIDDSICIVNPPIKATSLTINEEQQYKEFYLRLGYYSEKQLSVTVLPEDATDKSVTWTSSNPQLATVDETGKVVALNVGVCTITATTNDGSNLSDSRKVYIGTETGIESTDISISPIYVSNNSIVAPDDAQVYNAQGVPVGKENLSPGVYLVIANGRCHKVMVK